MKVKVVKILTMLTTILAMEKLMEIKKQVSNILSQQFLKQKATLKHVDYNDKTNIEMKIYLCVICKRINDKRIRNVKRLVKPVILTVHA